MENIKCYSEPEQNIINNKEKYIKLVEDSNEVIDITKDLLNLCDSFKLGQMVHTPDFTLEETMNSVELDHFKMDSHYNYREANTFRKLYKQGKVKKIEDLNNEEVKIIYNIRHCH